MTATGLPRILVILPRFTGAYVDKEIFGLIPGFDTFYASGESNLFQQTPARTKVVPVRSTGIPRSLGDAAGILGRVHDVKRLIERVRPAVIVTFELHSIVTWQVARYRAGLRFLHVVQAYETTHPNRGLWGAFPPTRFLAVRNSTRPDLFLAPSTLTCNMLTALGVSRSKILVLPLSVYSEQFDPALVTLKSHLEVLLYLGALRENKGLLTLVAALDLLWGHGSQSHQLVIAGSGPLADWVREQSADRAWLRFEGRVSESEKVKLLGEATLFVYPSEDTRLLGFTRWEEQGALSVVEAMMSGLPIVCTNSGAMSEIVPNENPIVPQKSPEDLRRAIERLLADPERIRRCSALNLGRARSYFDIRRNAQLLGKAIESRLHGS